MVLDPSQREFVKLISSTERRIAGYILTLVPNLSDADEILQETHVKLWEEQERFELGTDFAAWAIRVAHFEVLTWRKRRSRRPMIFDDALLNDLTKSIETVGELAEKRQNALVACLSELSDNSRNILLQIYGEGEKIKDIAVKLGKSAESTYKAVQRLRMALRDCIEQRLVEEDYV